MTRIANPSGAAARSATTDVSCWAFGPADAEIYVRNAELLLAHLSIFLIGWPFRRVGERDGSTADIDIGERANGRIAVTLHGKSGTESVFDTVFDAASGFAGVLIACFVARRTDMICLHAGGVQFGDGLVVVLGDSRVDRSGIALQMAASGYRLFADDRLVVGTVDHQPPIGMCLGLTPKVSLPLPADCGSAFREYVDSFTEIRDANVAYLKLWEGEAAGFPEQAPLSAIVVPEHRGSGACSLTPITGPDLVKALQVNCISPDPDVRASAPVLMALGSRVPGYALRYSNGREGAATLTAEFRDKRPDRL